MWRISIAAIFALLTLNAPSSTQAVEFSLYDAAKKGDVEMVRHLIAEGAEVDLRKENDAPIHAAAASGSPEVIELLLAAGADVNQVGFPGTALHVAAARGDLDIAKLLIAHGADIEAVDSFGNTPLHGAAMHGRHNIVGTLIAAGADVDTKSKDGTLPLVGAVTSGDFDTVHLLLDAGSDGVGWRDPKCPGETLLHHAVRHDYEAIARELLKAGADRSAVSDYGETPLSLAQQRGDASLVNLLREAVVSN